MINVVPMTVNISMPSDEVRIVAMQPFIKFHSKTYEPFRWADDAVDAQLAAISRTLDIAQRGFGGRHTNFTLFPEYSIPGIAGASAIDDRLSTSAWPNGSIVIAGVHGIAKAEYADMCNLLNAQFSGPNAPDSVPNGQWVNCCILWVKECNGVVRKWVQPKVRPAWPEMKVTCNDMFCGSDVYIFECRYDPSGYPCRFATLICFDWVASMAGTTVCQELLTKLNKLWTQSQPALDWVFIVQHNTKPNNPSFLNSTYHFLTDPAYAFVQRDKAIVLHANTAVSSEPARTGEGGFSACVLSPSAQLDCSPCRPTVCMQPSSLRASKILERCKDVVFREMGECIHAFTVRVPRFVTPDATDRTYPLPLAHVHATSDSVDPRLPGGPVAAAVKWLSDSLDSVERLSASQLAGCSLEARAGTIEPTIITKMRASDGHAASNSVNWAAGNKSRDKNCWDNADLWGADEAVAVAHVLHSLTSLGLAYGLEFESTILHGVLQVDEGFIQVVAIRGDTYQDCRLHYDNNIPHQGTDPVLVIARDRHNLIPTREEYLRIDEPAGERGLAFLDYQTLVTNCRGASDSYVLKEYLDGILPQPGRII